MWGADLIENNYEIHYEPEASVYHYHGIHHAADNQRAQQIVTIMERLDDTDKNLVESLNSRFGKGRVVGIIPIKGKCLSIDGKYLLSEIADHLKNCGLLEQTFVSTDSEFIKYRSKFKFQSSGFKT